MIGQNGRIAAAAGSPFAGSDIDRTRPIRFSLNGRLLHGFAGDTVLSAVLAAGINTAGTHRGHPLALSERFAPLVTAAGSADDGRQTLPMHRTPALDGLELTTLGRPRVFGGLWRRLFMGGDISLGHRFSAPLTPGAWLDAPADTTLSADLVVVGGGIGGLSTAVAAGRAGDRVILVERRQSLGGMAQLFGAVEGEDPPETIIARLKTVLAGLPNVTVLTHAEVFASAPGRLLAHRVEAQPKSVSGHVMALEAPRLVLATGTSERLPIFAGNRLPGVIGLAAAFDRAVRFGLWGGESSLINTGTNAGYRLAILANKAGATIPRITDTRLTPQSRFIEFSKAYGMTHAPGLKPQAVSAEKRGSGRLSVAFSHVLRQPFSTPDAVAADQLIVAGAFQPDLGLWLMAGGTSEWDVGSGMLVGREPLPGVALAGSAAGYQSNTACIQSGVAAVAVLFGRRPEAVTELLIDPIYESPDALTPIPEETSDAGPPAYLDAGASLLARPQTPAPHGVRRLLSAGATQASLQADTVLDIGDVAAAVALGLVPPADAARVAAERVLPPMDLLRTGKATARHADDEVPLLAPWLAGRFGPQASLWTLEATDGIAILTGALLFPNSDSADPLQAVGVIVRGSGPDRTAAIALVGGSAVAGERLVLRDGGRTLPVHLVAPEPAPVPA